MTDHIGADLSAYLDRALPAPERARVEAHLDSCSTCRARLAELRATASLIAALPSPRPSRSLTPSFVERFNWLRPLRSLSMVASGTFLFLFMATAVLETGSDLGGGPLAPFGPVPAAGPAAAPGAPERNATEMEDAGKRGETASATPPAAALQTQPTEAPTPDATGTRSVEPDATATPFNIGTSDPAEYGLYSGRPEGGIGAGSLSWLILSIVAAMAAFLAHRRLRRDAAG